MITINVHVTNGFTEGQFCSVEHNKDTVRTNTQSYVSHNWRNHILRVLNCHDTTLRYKRQEDIQHVFKFFTIQSKTILHQIDVTATNVVNATIL